MTLYAKRKPWELDEAGGYYHRHVAAMTEEGLHSKADIAAELGYRDREIDRLNAALEKVVAQAPLVNIPAVCRQCRAALTTQCHVRMTDYGFETVATVTHATPWCDAWGGYNSGGSISGFSEDRLSCVRTE